jgi:ubiquinone/menaquinone biosynthesis C-methylase UbiE
MNMQINHSNEQQAAFAFTRQSAIFDELYAANSIVQYKRKRVRNHLMQYLKPGSNILELNAGTGDDAIFLAQQGNHVHATDISIGMQEKLTEKVAGYQLTSMISNELCSFTALGTLKNKGPYDCIFSNFAGLNCTGELQAVLNSFDSLLKPGGIAVLVVLPKFCLWETALFVKGKFKTATRRFLSSGGRKAKIDGASFRCWYYSPGFIVNRLKIKFELLAIEGLCTIVPPSYIENFAEKYPKTFSYLCKMENRLKGKWPWKYVGDYYIISLRKK